MAMVRVDTQRAYDLIREKIITLELAPGQAINEQQLAAGLDMGRVPVQEALNLLTHDGLVVVSPRHGFYVAEVGIPDLEQLSETRLALESLCARLAARRATADDLAVLEALEQEAEALLQGAAIDGADSAALARLSRRLFDLDHNFHQAIARAAHNKYLAQTLDYFFGLSQRLWYLALPEMGFLPAAVREHVEMVAVIKAGDADRAEQMMRAHVQDFYDQVHRVLAALEE